MSVTFEDFLKPARTLLENKSSTEIDFRNLISRSYYAVFHLAKEKSDSLFDKAELSENNNSQKSHENVLTNYSHHPNKAIKQLGKMLFDLKDNRVKADYKTHETVLRNEAAQHFYVVKGVIQKLQQIETK